MESSPPGGEVLHDDAKGSWARTRRWDLQPDSIIVTVTAPSATSTSAQTGAYCGKIGGTPSMRALSCPRSASVSGR